MTIYCCGYISSESAFPVALTKMNASVVVHKIQLLTHVIINAAPAVIVFVLTGNQTLICLIRTLQVTVTGLR